MILKDNYQLIQNLNKIMNNKHQVITRKSSNYPSKWQNKDKINKIKMYTVISSQERQDRLTLVGYLDGDKEIMLERVQSPNK